MAFYRRRLEKDLARWRAEGWVDAAGAEAILADVRASDEGGLQLWDVLAILGAALICLAASAFVAANWAAIPRPVKLGLLVALMWAFYGLAVTLRGRGAAAAAHAALLVGVGLFGASVMLVGQMYHLSGPPQGALLVWALGALATAALFQSAPATFLGALLVFGWAEWSGLDPWRPFWWFLPAWAGVALVAWRARWSGGFHLVMVGLAIWTLILGFRLGRGELEGHVAPTLAGALLFLLGLLALRSRGLKARFDALRPQLGESLAIYGFVMGFGGLYFIQLLAEDTLFAAFAAAALGALVGVLWLAVVENEPTLLWWAYAALAAELMLIYVRTVGTLLDTSLFFLVAGLLVVGLAALARRLHLARQARAAEGAP